MRLHFRTSLMRDIENCYYMKNFYSEMGKKWNKSKQDNRNRRDLSKKRIEAKTIKELSALFTKVGYSSDGIFEKTHIIYHLVEDYCHTLVFYKHEALDYAKVKQILTDTIIHLLGEKHS